MSHTATPWNTGTDEDAHMIYDSGLQAVASTLRDDGDAVAEAANAQLIVRAVNSHQALVDALEPFADLLESPEDFKDGDVIELTISPKDVAAARDAIAQARQP